jgi:hypothetical protein
MFKEIVSQLAFSPATVGRLSEYAKKVKQKQRISGWVTFLFALLLLIHIVFPLFGASPAATPTQNDLVAGGVATTEIALNEYNKDTNGFRDALSLLSIKESDLQQLSEARYAISQFDYVTGLVPYGTPNERSYSMSGVSHPIYIRSAETIASGQSGWEGTTSDGTEFFILKADGNILTSKLPTPAPAQSPFRLGHTLSTNQGALSWELVVTNPLDRPQSDDLSFSIADIYEYAIVDTPAGAFISDADQRIIWPGFTLDANESKTLHVTARFTRQTNHPVTNSANPFSYDCRITTVFGNTQEGPVECPIYKRGELWLRLLPHPSASTLIIIYSTLLVVSALLYVRLRLLTEEIRIIRTQLNTGGL